MQTPPDSCGGASDEALLTRFAAGDAAAAQALTERLTPRVYRHALRLLGGDGAEAEDVAQDAMLRLWRAASGWRPGEARVTTWLYRVVANLCFDRHRKARMVALGDIDEPCDTRAGAVPRIVARQRADALQAALDALPARQRQAVVLRHIEGLGNPEIARVMDISVEAVESLTARGRKALGVALAGRRAELGFEDD
ncbi:RNA polymerase sigma factor [Sediminimonas sp.]|uniref:RNA polymerase sigma factor n=1 Tax=Sediminimonas sp. TaxID=2823379 RepID=UPI0025D6485B|nr:RNA polymerase sigma factor [Sediminimonas sp.]